MLLSAPSSNIVVVYIDKDKYFESLMIMSFKTNTLESLMIMSFITNTLGSLMMFMIPSKVEGGFERRREEVWVAGERAEVSS